jgi:hypothetical protein
MYAMCITENNTIIVANGVYLILHKALSAYVLFDYCTVFYMFLSEIYCILFIMLNVYYGMWRNKQIEIFLPKYRTFGILLNHLLTRRSGLSLILTSYFNYAI